MFEAGVQANYSNALQKMTELEKISNKKEKDAVQSQLRLLRFVNPKVSFEILT